MAFDELSEIAASHVQSADSVHALKAALRMPDFIVRDETTDYGTDFTVELGVDGRASNFRFQIQLKSERRRGVGYRGRQPRRRTTSHEGNDLQDEVAVLSGVQPGGLASDPGEMSVFGSAQRHE